jgi:hypothetical protein
MMTGQVGMIHYMTNLHCDEHTFSESMLYLCFQVFGVSLFKGAGIVFLPACRLPAGRQGRQATSRLLLKLFWTELKNNGWISEWKILLLTDP